MTLHLLRVLVAFACLALAPILVRAQQKSATGLRVGMAFRSYTPTEPYNWRGAKTHALLTTIWYPAVDSTVEQPLQVPGLNIFLLGSVARNAELAVAPRKFPLILLSHGTGGTALSLAWFGTALAAHGYIVAGVNHPGNNAAEPYTVEGFSTWWEQARDLSEVIDVVLKDSTFGSRIDATRVGAAGFSLGGYTMIEIAGGITDPAAFIDFCASPKADGICTSPPEFPTLFEDFQKLVKENPEFLRHATDSYHDARVRSVFAMAPALGPAFRPASLTKITIPVEIVAGEGDTNVPISSGAKYFAGNIPGSKLIIYPGAVGHYVFLDSCTEIGQKSASILCKDAASVKRDVIHAQMIDSALQFFGHTL
jgi:predicted dienelactone hydrolase